MEKNLCYHLIAWPPNRNPETSLGSSSWSTGKTAKKIGRIFLDMVWEANRHNCITRDDNKNSNKISSKGHNRIRKIERTIVDQQSAVECMRRMTDVQRYCNRFIQTHTQNTCARNTFSSHVVNFYIKSARVLPSSNDLPYALPEQRCLY